jgi:DNA-binding NarL/FixJ family response regulator
VDIEHNTDWRVCGEAENGQVAVAKVGELKPHVVILDLTEKSKQIADRGTVDEDEDFERHAAPRCALAGSWRNPHRRGKSRRRGKALPVR